MATAQQAKIERVQIRIDRGAKRMLKRAAALANTTVSAFLVNSALDAAERLIRERQQIILNEREWDAFLELLSNPPKPNAAMRKALTLHRRLIVRTAQK